MKQTKISAKKYDEKSITTKEQSNFPITNKTFPYKNNQLKSTHICIYVYKHTKRLSSIKEERLGGRQSLPPHQARAL